MNRFFQRVSVISIAVTWGVLSLSPMAYAASVSGDGYRVSPVTDGGIVINKGASKVVQVYVQNVSSATENVQTVVNDFIASASEDGSPSLLLNGASSGSHGLKQYITVENPKFILAPQQQETVNVKISIPSNAAPGGYYGAIRFAPASLVNAKNVSLSASVASLLLVTVPGKITENMSISTFDVTSGGSASGFFTTNKNLQVEVAFSNNGQVQEQPFGKVVLMKNSKQVGVFPINNKVPAGYVLPNSIRKFKVNLDQIGSLGKYTVIGNFGYGSKGQLLTASTTFYVVTWPYIVGAIVLLLVIVGLIVLAVRKLHRKK